MSFEQKLREFNIANASNTTSLESVAVERANSSVWDTSDIHTEFVTTGSWEPEETDRLGDDKCILPLSNTELSTWMSNIEQYLTERTTIHDTDTRITDVEIRPSVDYESLDAPWEEQQEAYRGFQTVHHEPSDYTNSGKRLLESILAVVRNGYDDPDVAVQNLLEAEVWFDDFEFCSVSSIKGCLNTSVPHQYYNDVSSLNEFCEVKSERSDETYEQLVAKDRHRVFFSVDLEENEELVEQAEDFMKTRIDTLLSIDSSWSHEAEAICFGPEIQDTDSLEVTTFFVRHHLSTEEIEDRKPV